MTTIAYRDGVLAADRRKGNGWIEGEATKIHRVGEWLFAGSGAISEIATAHRLIEAGVKEFPKVLDAVKVDDSRVIIIKRNQIFEVQKGGWFTYPVGAFHAWGSGFPPALGAMHMGAGAVRAVEIAMLVDPESGDGVDVLELGK